MHKNEEANAAIRKRTRRFKLMPKRCILSGAIFLWAIPLFLSMSVYAQPQGALPPAERTVWDHNGSIMYLLAIGSSRELHYQKPRPGMLEAGARPDDILFKGEIDDEQIAGTAYIFNAQCGKVPFRVKGPISENGGKIVLTGQVPRIGRNCQTVGEYTTTLEFKLLKTSEVGQLSPATVQMPIVEQPTPGPSPAEGKLSNNPSAQPGRTRQTPWTEDSSPKAPPTIPLCITTYRLKWPRRRNRLSMAQSVPPTRKRLPLHQLSRRFQPWLPQPHKVSF